MCKTGIYLIKNEINQHMYVGQAKDINARWIHHRSDLKNGRHSNNHLQSAWNLYGGDNFTFSILEECKVEELDEREQFWINKLDTYNNGYNQDLGGGGIRGYKHTPEEIEKMRRVQNPKIVLQFDLNFNFIAEWIGGASHIKRVLGYTKECILLRCEHTIKGKMTPYKNSYWIFKDEYISSDFNWDSYLSNFRIDQDKVICQYDFKLNLVKKWNSHHDLIQNGYNLKQIIGICNHTCASKTYKNSIWAYDGYDFSDGYFALENGEYKKGLHNKRKVAMLDLKDGEIIKCFDSISDACVYINKPVKFRSNICQSITTGHRAGGYYWKYMD